MSETTPSDLQDPWVLRCLQETGWSAWQPRLVLGQGAWSRAVLVGRQSRYAVLLLDRPDRPPIVKPGTAGSLDIYRSAAAIRIKCKRSGLPVAWTMGAPRSWSGGAAVLLSRVPGQDLEHLLDNPSLDGKAISRKVAEIVAGSRSLGLAHRRHASGFGYHMFGLAPPMARPVDAWAFTIAPLRGHDAAIDALIGQLETRATEVLDTAPRVTQIWDVGDRNIMLNEQGQVVGLVDQVDMFTGDPLLVPGFSLAMLGDVHQWSQIEAYTQGWREAWAIDDAQWARVELHRLACHGRFIGKRWGASGPGMNIEAWVARARAMLG